MRIFLTAQGLVLEYSFSADTVWDTVVTNIGSGGTALNGALLNGTVVGSYGVGSSQYVELSTASGQYVQIPSFSTGNTGLSFSIWFKTTSLTSDWGCVFDMGNGYVSDNIVMFVYGGNLGVCVYSGSSAEYPLNVVSNVGDGLWRHVVWTMDPSGTWVVYENGVQVWTAGSLYYPSSISRKLNYLGKSNWGRQYVFDGSISDFRMYSYVMSAGAVKSLYKSSAHLPVPSAHPTPSSRPSISRYPTGESHEG